MLSQALPVVGAPKLMAIRRAVDEAEFHWVVRLFPRVLLEVVGVAGLCDLYRLLVLHVHQAPRLRRRGASCEPYHAHQHQRSDDARFVLFSLGHHVRL